MVRYHSLLIAGHLQPKRSQRGYDSAHTTLFIYGQDWSIDESPSWFLQMKLIAKILPKTIIFW